MSSSAYMTDMMQNHIGPEIQTTNVGARIAHCAKKLGMSVSRASCLWYNDGRYRPSPEEALAAGDYTGIYYGSQERAELERHIAKATAYLDNADAGSDRALVHALRAVIGALDRT